MWIASPFKRMVMNKILSVLVMILFSNLLSAQDQPAKVHFIRSEGFQAPAAGFTVFIDRKNVGHLNNKTYSVYNVAPGSHVFSTQFVGKNPKDKAEKMEMKLESGKTYYIRVRFKHGFLQNKLKLKEIDENEAKPLISKSRQIKN